MLLVAAIAILVTMALALARALLGPSVYDRVLAVNMFGTKTVLLIAVMAFIMGRTDFLDLALAYALINFIGVLAVLWFVQESRKRHPSGNSAQTTTESNME
ncbi:monovalent cation/H+ antiporter complex subunit F [Haliea sp.]|uniref:monovalent cation/H+ antiporter complex subunit F n=1 Tax=Haliea sp. TaxID=1932666 RepID=UPI00352940FB